MSSTWSSATLMNMTRQDRHDRRIAALADDLDRPVLDIEARPSASAVVAAEAQLRTEVERFADGVLLGGADDIVERREVSAVGDVEELARRLRPGCRRPRPGPQRRGREARQCCGYRRHGGGSGFGA